MQRDFSQLANQHFDVLICGGGIYGAWTAYDATLRGLKVAIVDQGDWANATSSASSKLIHGGLRYLESYDFKLVKKSLLERQMLLKVAPHRVWALRFAVPVYKHSRLGAWSLRVGLRIYDFLATGLSKDQRYRHYNAADFSARFPELEAADLTAGFSYLDAQTDDARLVLELIAGACELGAVCVNYCQVTELLTLNEQLHGAVIQDQLTHTIGKVYAKQIVDTMGRWSPHQIECACRLSKGVHLVMPKILNEEALLLTAESDGRVFFIIPWYGRTLLGTTDSDYHGDINQLTVEQHEIDYLLSEANCVLKNTHWQTQDIIGSYAGLRVLQASSESSVSNISRDWQLNRSPCGLLSSIGGKLTSAREDASQLVDALCQQLGLNLPCRTFGRAFPWSPDLDYNHWVNTALSQATALNIDSESAHWLLRRHGCRVSDVFALCEQQPDLTKRILPTLPFIMADMVFCAQQEMVVHLEDLLRRRLPLMILAKLTSCELQELALIAAKVLAWSDERRNQEYTTCWQQTNPF
ncbi:MAG: glycerol-3-phosphate dehydrogenase/oxidase [Methylococcaceae bacterium]|nr:glycerol-3-phosphate dehydrogenase/oxidase [Methylococcaceae bacterium]